MAEGKKGFILYADIIHTVKKLPIEKRGELFTIILEYVNDKNPEVKDLLVDLVWEPIKLQLKRDLKKYESRAKRSRENGKLGGRPITQPNPEEPSGLNDNPEEPKKPDIVIVNDTDTVNDTVTGNVKVKKKRVAASGPPDEYKNIVKLWFKHSESITGLKPKFVDIDGKQLKSIIKYLSNNQNEGQKTEDTFKYILDNWGSLEKWLQQNCLDLKIFNQKINIIISQLKNGKGKESNSISAKFVEHLRKNDPNFKNY